VDDIIANPAFHPYMCAGPDGLASTPKQHNVHLIVHRIPWKVANDDRYVSWARNFGDRTHVSGDFM
jgi:hypothetical protein